MGAIAVAGMTICLWRVASAKAALMFVAFVMFGVSYYLIKDEQRPCNDRAWFCHFVPERGIGFVGPPEYVDPCPDDVEPLKVRVFASDAAEAEMRRLIATGVCQGDAIDRVHRGWKAPYDPQYGSWWQRLFR